MEERQSPDSLQLQSVVSMFTVNDLAASMAWYRDVLGFVITEEMKQDDKLMGAMLKAGNVDILIGQDDFAKGRDRKKAVGLRLFWVTDQDVDALAAAITSRGGVLTHPPRDEPWGARVFAIADPDGLQISITTPPKD